MVGPVARPSRVPCGVRGGPRADPDEIVSLLSAFRGSISDTNLIVINSPEVALPPGIVQRDDQHLRSRAINDRLDEYVARSDVQLIDLREHVQAPADLAGDGLLTHYARHVYAGIADDVAAALNQ